MKISSIGNVFLHTNAPWVLYKEGNIEECEKVLSFGIFIAFVVTKLLKPIIPTTCSYILEHIGIDENKDFKSLKGIQIELSKEKYQLPFRPISLDEILIKE